MPKILRSRPRSILGAFQTTIFMSLPPFQACDPAGDQQEGHQKHQTAHREYRRDENAQSQRQRADPQTMLAVPSHVVPSSLPGFCFILCGRGRSGDGKKKAFPSGKAFQILRGSVRCGWPGCRQPWCTATCCRASRCCSCRRCCGPREPPSPPARTGRDGRRPWRRWP